jgi:dihydroxyacetone kinase
MASTAETASGEMALEVGEVPVEGTRLAADEAELGVTFGGAVGAQAETIRKTPQIASSAR